MRKSKYKLHIKRKSLLKKTAERGRHVMRQEEREYKYTGLIGTTVIDYGIVNVVTHYRNRSFRLEEDQFNIGNTNRDNKKKNQ